MSISSHSIYIPSKNAEEFIDDLLYRLGDTTVPSKLRSFENAKRLNTAGWIPKSCPILHITAGERSPFEYITYEAARIFNIIMKVISDWFTTFSIPEVDIESEKFNRITTRLRRSALITPKQQLLLQDSFRKKNLHNIQTTLLQIIGMLDIQTEKDRIAIQALLNKGKFLAAFEYIDMIHILNDFNSHMPEWSDLITESSKIEISAGVGEMQTTGSIDRLYKELCNLIDRWTAKQWLDQLLKNSRLEPHKKEILRVADEIKLAISQNNPTFCKSKLIEFIDYITPKLNGLDKISLEELKDSLLETGRNVFYNLATQHRQDLYLSSWNSEIETVSSLLKTEISTITNNPDKSEDEKSITVNKLLHKTLTLYTAFGEIVESEQAATLSPTKHAAHIGKAVATWRKINDLFNRKTACEKSHTTCGCHYAAKKLPAETKWKAFPEKIDGLSSIETSPSSCDKEKKTILLITNTFGGGHMSATNALIEYSKMDPTIDYHVRALNLPLEVLLPFDAVHKTLGMIWPFMNSDWLYNLLMSYDKCDILEHLKSISSKEPSAEQVKKIKTAIRQAILKQKPDMIVATCAMHSRYLFEVSEELGIPLINTLTDFQLDGTEKLTPPKHFKMAIPAGHPDMLNSIGKGEDFIEKHVEITGPPIRPQFLKSYKPDEILPLRRKLGIADNENVVFFVSGALGLQSAIPETLSKWNPERPVRIIVICGKNSAFAEKLKKEVIPSIANPGRVSMEVFGLISAEKMAEYMNVADVVIGKPGGAITAEAAHVGVRYLGDQTGPRFAWEKFNNALLQKIGSADTVKSAPEVIEKVEAALLAGRPKARLFETTEFSKNYLNLFKSVLYTAEKDTELMNIRKTYSL